MAANVIFQSPLEEYTAAISENFPLIARKPVIETSIFSKERLDFLPVNLTSNQNISGNYLEYRIPYVPGKFLDLSQIWIDTKLKITKGANDPLEDTDNIVVANGLSNTLFKSVQVYLNDRLVESNPFYAYMAYLRMLTTLSKEAVDQFGSIGGLFNYKTINSSLTAANIAQLADEIKAVRTKLSGDGKRLFFPLFLDICTIDQYLIDGVSLRIRLELNSTPWIITSPVNTTAYNLDITESTLWINRITPQQAAITAFNKTFSRAINYTFTRTLFKSYILPANQTSIVCEDLWNNIIPEKIYMLIVDLDAYSGSLTQNALYFKHNFLNSFHVMINGSTVANPHFTFPEDTENIYGHTIQALGLAQKHLINYKQFSQGQSVFCIDFKSENLEGVLSTEQIGRLRISLSFSQGVNSSQIILFFGDTTGILSITPDYSIITDFRG